MMSMTAAQILTILPANYARLFPDQAGLRKAYAALLKTWHPDHNTDPKAAEVTNHLIVLYEAACKARDTGTWAEPNSLRVIRNASKTQFLYEAKVAAPAGDLHIGRHRYVITAKAGMDDLCAHAIKMMTALPAVPEKMRDEFAALLPRLENGVSPESGNGYSVLIDFKSVRLRDLLDKHGPLDPKHVAWIMSGAYNLACYFDFAGITHLGFDIDHVFIVPETHQVAIPAGWEFAALRHAKPLAAPPATVALLGKGLTAEPTARRHHLSLIRAMGRACLGDPSGAGLLMRTDLPRPFTRWLQLPGGRSAQSEYEAWSKCLVDSFGPRRFHKLSVTHSDIYGS